MLKNRYSYFVYAALNCEAKPLIERFALKKQLGVKVFAVYCNEEICLTVTGVGKNAMSAAIAYTQALFASDSPVVFLNIGIAGHKDYPLGQLYLIDKINDRDSGKNYYPPLVFKSTLQTASLQTVAKPVQNYHESYLCDMEASAFYETAARFSSGELIQCLKIVSDNTQHAIEAINSEQVTEWIAAKLPEVELVLLELHRLAQSITRPEITLLAELTQRYRFTVNETMQLKNHLLRWQVLTDGQALDRIDMPVHSGKAVLRWLEKKLADAIFCL